MHDVPVHQREGRSTVANCQRDILSTRSLQLRRRLGRVDDEAAAAEV
jgi:hypothetical protein